MREFPAVADEVEVRRASEPHALYLHIPFCTTKCTYCAFNTYTRMEALIPPFIAALCQELRLLATARPGLPVHTVFFGGGTPSLLNARQLSEILTTIADGFSLDAAAEITLEANPNDVDETYAREIRALGINRISLGMQSAQDHELRLFARRHGNEHLTRAVSAIRAAGFDDFNLDLIFGIPHQRLTEWRDSLQQALRLGPTHLSLYALSLEEGTPLRDWVARGELPEPDDDCIAEMYERASDWLAAAGYEQYEISNWCRSERECRHNLQYWRNLPYLACGPGAHGYADGIRYRNLRSPARYIELLTEPAPSEFPLTPVVEHYERVDAATERAETIMMSLRLTREGIDLATFRARLGVDLLAERAEAIARFQKAGMLMVVDGALRLTNAGRFVSNAILRDLL